MKLPGITGSVLLIIFKSLISLCFITCLIRISWEKWSEEPTPWSRLPKTSPWDRHLGQRDKFKFTRKIWKYE